MGKQELLKQSKISIILDSYDDIFSDFDPRFYSERSLSDDFLNETKKVCRGKNFIYSSLQLMLPTKMRDKKYEDMIADRLHRYFEKHYYSTMEEIKAQRKRGAVFMACGVILMSLATYLSLEGGKSFIMNFLRVLVEPGGWFCLWNGFDQIIFAPNQKKTDLSFFDTMSKIDINFIPF
ncbi:MAG: hypothetical protein MUD12_11920 [Spirochaetes bacterium]|jgi:hypothetical protein|nr:hypothetical protein [Spirochaetota bacterium]